MVEPFDDMKFEWFGELLECDVDSSAADTLSGPSYHIDCNRRFRLNSDSEFLKER